MLAPSRLSAKMRYRGLTINGSVLAEMHYESLKLPKFKTADPFLSADDERWRQASLKHNEEKGRLAAESLAWRYVQDVIKLLEKQILPTDTGLAVLDAINRATMDVEINPDISDPKDYPNAGAIVLEPVGPRSRESEPKDVLIQFTPANWKRDDALAELLKEVGVVMNDEWGPGTLPDEVLLHELVHALFDATGKQLKRRVPFQGGRYQTESWNPKHPDWRGPYEMDEFMAIMITNIYHSERGRAFIRHSHTDFRAHDISDDEFLGIGMNRAHVQLLRRKQPKLFDALNNVTTARWNPLRHFRDSL